jgi:hypothetical protein
MKGSQPRTNIVKDEKGGLVTYPTVFWLGGGTISLSYWIYLGLMMWADINTYSKTTSAWAKCLWGWEAYGKPKKTYH